MSQRALLNIALRMDSLIVYGLHGVSAHSMMKGCHVGSTIQFTFSLSHHTGQTHLYVYASIVNSNPGLLPRSVYEAGARATWATFANNLNAA